MTNFHPLLLLIKLHQLQINFSTLLCMIPFILELHQIAVASISRVITKSHGDKGHPYLITLVK